MIKKFLVCFCIFTLIINLCACSADGKNMFKTKSDQDIANEKLDKVLQALENNDPEALKKLFSVNAINSSDSFESDLQLLIDYFDGKTIFYNNQCALNVSRTREDDFEKKAISSTYDVETDKQIYRIAIQDVITNTLDQNDVGINSLYIIIKSDDTDHNYAYRGDGKNTPGINIGIKNIIP